MSQVSYSLLYFIVLKSTSLSGYPRVNKTNLDLAQKFALIILRSSANKITRGYVLVIISIDLERRDLPAVLITYVVTNTHMVHEICVLKVRPNLRMPSIYFM